MSLIRRFTIILIVFWSLVTIEAAWINVTLSSENIQNGTSMRFTAASSPIIGGNFFDNLECEYTEQDGTGPTLLAEYNRYASPPKMVIPVSASATVRARLNLTSSINPMELDIYPITFGDEKRLFYCTLKYAESGSVRTIVSDKHQLQNVYSPHVINEAQSMQNSTSMTAGKPGNLTCIATGRPASNITWLYSSFINATTSVTYEGSPLITVTSVLTIHNPTQSVDGQQITCVVSNQFSPTINRTTILNVDYLPLNTTFTVYPENPKLNQAINLNCSAVGKPAVTMYSFHVNGIFIGNSSNGTLSVVANNCSKYNGIVTCTPINGLGTGEIESKPLVVTDDVKTSVTPPSVMLNETQNATVQCSVSGCPASFSISWSKDGQLLNASESNLVLNSVGKSDAGQYSCFAQNGYTNSSSKIQVTVNYKPIATSLLANDTKPVVNTSVTFSCKTDALPKAKYRFYRIDSSGENEVSSLASGTTGVLVVSKISLAGYNVTYKCVPSNILGDGKEDNVKIDIQDPAKIDQFKIEPRNVTEFQSSVSIQCTASGNPLPTVTVTGPSNMTVSQNGSVTLNNSVSRNSAGLYTCTASNGIGSSVSRTADLVVYYIPSIQSFSSIPSKVYNGSRATISCNADGNPTPSFRFYNENGSLLQDSSSSNYTLTLRFENYQAYRTTFRCVPYNSIGEGAAQNLAVEILVLPRVSISVSPSIVNEADNATISCAVTAANPPANITIRGPTNQEIEHTNGSAVLTNLSRNDAGSYSCIASNGLIGSPVVVQASLAVNHEPDQVQLTASSLKPITGSSVTLTCAARASPPPRFRFIFINGSSIRTVQDNSTSNYIISSIDYRKYTNFSAKYRCIANNSYGESASQDITLDIQVPPSISFSIAPNIVNETQNATVECRVNVANPSPSITITDSNSQTISNVGGQANIARITRNQAGVYTCAANNGIGGVVRATSNLTVYHAPDQVKLTASSYSPTNGTSLTLQCSARAAPSPNRYKFTRIRGSSEVTLQDNSFSTHMIAAIDHKNYDNYKATFACVPFNKVGSGLSKNVTVDIQVSPEISMPSTMTVTEGETVTLFCNVTAANPAANITWLNHANLPIPNTNGRTQLSSINRNQNGVYTCQASNGVGVAAFATTALTVHYGPKISQNNTEFEKCIGESVAVGCSATGSPKPDVSLYLNGALLSKNSSSLRYITQVNAANKFGVYICESNNTIGKVNVTTIVKVKAPGTVGNVQVTPKDNTITVSWSLPQCINNIKEIKVQYKKTSESTWRTEPKTPKPTDTQITITGLDKDAEYEVRLVVVDVGGKSHMTQGADIARTEKGETNGDAPLIGGIVGGIIFIIIVILVCYLFAKKRRRSSSAEDGMGITNHGATVEKTKTIEMKEVDDNHYRAPDGSVYASIKGKSGNDMNGAIDNANFVADSDGTYDTAKDEPQKKKDEGNYASLGSFQSPNSSDKPKEKPKTDYATLEELGPLKDFEEPQKGKEEEQHTHKITVEPESGEAPDETAPAADTATSEPAANTATSEPSADTASSAPPVDTSGGGDISGSVDMI